MLVQARGTWSFSFSFSFSFLLPVLMFLPNVGVWRPMGIRVFGGSELGDKKFSGVVVAADGCMFCWVLGCVGE